MLLLAVALTGCFGDGDTAEEPFRVGVVTSENQADTAERHEPLVGYLSRKLSRPVELREASDYAAVIEALKSRRLDLAYFGPASYARAWLATDGRIVPLVSPVDASGVRGYHSVLIVKSDSPYQSLEDLRGKNLAFVDPNSTSGYHAVHFYLTRQGYPPEELFGKVGFSGSHDNSILAVINGAYDAAGVWWNNERYSSFQRMEIKGMIEAGAVRTIWKSPLLPDRPWTVHADMDEPLREQVKAAMLSLPKEDPEAFQRLTDGLVEDFREVTHEEFVDVIEMLRQNQEARRQAR